MIKYFCLLFSLNIIFSLNAQEHISPDSIKRMYKNADIIFTAIVIYENIIGNTTGEEKMIDFDITEIQKGKDYSRLMVYTNDTMQFEQGKEYLVFAQKDKISNRYNLFFAEHVCKSCTNYTIKKVYEIVDKTPFKTIKKPRDKTPWNQRGCGCH
ncbi:MAG: hypothetical protein HPY79_06645 [Bacteroidales bacterium]|nr:hypothetical protein [Bacteroidales bacterium]